MALPTQWRWTPAGFGVERFAPPRRHAWARVAAWVLVAVLIGSVEAQRLEAQQSGARLFDEQDGLNSLPVSDIAQDHAGNLWVATDNGLFEYSGSHFEEFGREDGFNDPAINSLVVDHGGVVWAGTHTGLYWFDGQRFREAQYQGQSLRIGINTMLAARATGELVVQTAKGTFSAVADGAGGWQVERYRARHPEFPGYADTDGVGVTAADQLVIGCDSAICIDGQQFGTRQGVPRDYYVSFFTARDGQLWARGRKHILAWRPGEARMRDLSAGFPAGGIKTVFRRMTEDSYGNLLTPTAEGLATWDGRRWSETRRTSKGPLHSVTRVLCDREGSVWIGTEGEGLLELLGYRRWANYGTEDGLSNPTINALAEDGRGRIWVGSNLAANLVKPDGNGLSLTPLGAGEGALNTAAFAPTPDGGMWVASLMGQLTHTSAEGRADGHASIDAYISAMELDGDGVLWASTSGGLYAVRCPAGDACTPTLLASMGAKSVHDLLPDGQGGLWVTSDKGLDHLEHGGLTHIEVAGLRQNFSRIAAAGPGELWLAGMTPGLIRVRLSYTEATVVERHTRGELLSDRIDFLHRDREGRLWIGTDHGVNVLAGGRMTGISIEDGLSWNSASVMLEARDGSIWIGTTHGLSHLLDPGAALARPGFAAFIGRVVYRGMDLAKTPRARWVADGPSFYYGAATFRENRSLVYHYRLIGLEGATTTTHAVNARYSKLPPGRYTFRVVAEDPVHHVFSSPAEVSFTLVPPWQKSWVMGVLVVGLCFGAINLVWHLSHRMLLAQQSKLARMVAERTREIELLSLRDSLTGVLNRRAIMARLDEEVEYARRHGTALCIALLDLDHFKQINDTCGHLAGDEVLREAARRLGLCVRASDAIGRYGGEEFIILFRNVEREFGQQHCERVRQCLASEPVFYEGRPLAVTCSMGLVWSRKAAEFGTGLLAQADHAMYQAKQKGRNRVEYAFVEEEPVGVLAYSPA